jgi:hypothetical protein
MPLLTLPGIIVDKTAGTMSATNSFPQNNFQISGSNKKITGACAHPKKFTLLGTDFQIS